MATKPPIANSARVEVFSHLIANPTVKAVNVLHVLSPGSPVQLPSSDCAAIATIVAGSISGPTGWCRIAEMMSEMWQIDSVQVADNGGGEAVASHTINQTGTSGTTCNPPQVAVCLSWNINARYRGGKPRSYIAGIPNNATVNVGDSSITTTYANNIKTYAEGFLTDVNGGTVGGEHLVLGVASYSRKSNPTYVPTIIPFTGCEVHLRLDSQRRRSGKESSFAEVGP